MTATKTPKKPLVRRPLVQPAVRNGSSDDEACVVIPPAAFTLAGFREWSGSDAIPERGRITFLGGEITVDMGPERIGSHNAVKAEIYRVVGSLVVDDDLGKFYPDGARFVHKGAEVSNEPDSLAVLWETFEKGIIRHIPTKEGDDWIELEGTPDWVVEIVSPSSVTKDTVKLLDRYHRAGVPEYWLIDVRGDKLDFKILIHHPDGYHPAPTRGGWQKSKVFGKLFRLVRYTDRLGELCIRLEMK